MSEDDTGDTGGPHRLTFAEIKQAAELIDGAVIHTPLCEAKISKYMDYHIYLKCENLQYTGSCAERGIRSVLAALCNKEEQPRGVVVASSGNMALATAHHAALLNLPATVVVPNGTSPTLAHRCVAAGIDVVLCGDNMNAAYVHAKKLQKAGDLTLITADDPRMMAGLGTVGVEIISQLPETDAVIVPVAAGALLAGVLVACKKLKCSCLVYGVECAKVPTMMRALQAGNPVPVPVEPSLADGLSATVAGTNAFHTVHGRLDRMLLVEEAMVASAVVTVLERERLVVDGAGAVALAAVIGGLVPELRGRRAVCILTGGNVDCTKLAKLTQRGLAASGRLLRVAVPLSDRCAPLDNLAKVVSEQGVLLRSMVTDHSCINADLHSMCVNLIVETANEEHAIHFKDTFRDLYPMARFAGTEFDDKHKFGVR